MSNLNLLQPNQARTDYQEYLLSKHWQAFRAEAIEFYGKQCFYPYCERIENFGCYCNINHLNYNHMGKEELSDVVPLCQYHHHLWHEGFLNCPRWIIANQEKRLDEAGLMYAENRIDWSLIRETTI